MKVKEVMLTVYGRCWIYGGGGGGGGKGVRGGQKEVSSRGCERGEGCHPSGHPYPPEKRDSGM